MDIEYLLYDNGEIIGKSKVKLIDGVKVVTSMFSIINNLKEQAAKDGINLVLASGLRTWEDQMSLRKRNVKDKTKVNDIEYLTNAPASDFNPFVGKPGWSNHHDGSAFDFKVTGQPKVYAWLVGNGFKNGFIRTVPSERWHWEYRPNQKTPFTFVKKNDLSWDGLADTILLK